MMYEIYPSIALTANKIRITFFPRKLFLPGFVKMISLLLLGLIANKPVTQAQVTAVYSDYGGYWTSSSSSINTTQPDNSHNMLAFTWNGTTYSTGVNDAVLTSHGVTFTPQSFRAFPINSVPSTALPGVYFVMLGQLYDGVNNGVVNGGPFAPSPTGAQLAAYLTDGVKGLNLGTGLANIPGGNQLLFDMSANGITLSAIGDGIPDVFVTEMALPSSNSDTLRFVDNGGNPVGTPVIINQNALTSVGNWVADFYDFTATQSSSSFINSTKTMRFYAADLSAFGINSGNYQNARTLIYIPNGASDPAFIAFNEPAISVATQLTLTTAPSSSYQTNIPLTTQPVVQVRDGLNQVINQAGIPVTVSILSGTGTLSGTLTAITNANGTATFSGVTIIGSSTVTLQFSSASLNTVASGNITTTPLTLTWLDFTAQQQTGGVVLKWSTATENNTKDFIVERSADGISWQTVGAVTAAYNSLVQQNYQYTDATPDKGINYYRLLQRDMDGNSSYSVTVVVSFADNQQIFAYPNPVVNGVLNIRLQHDATVNVYNSIGELVLSKQYAAGTQQVNMHALAKGLYWVHTGTLSALIALQ